MKIVTLLEKHTPWVTNVILALFAIFAFIQVSGQFEVANRPYIGLASGSDESQIIVESTAYDKKPDVGTVWLPKDVGLGITLSLSLQNYGASPAFFEITTSSITGDLLPYDSTQDSIMPNQIKRIKWNFRMSNNVPDIKNPLFTFVIDYSRAEKQKRKYKTIVTGKWLEIPTEDKDARSKFPIRIGINNKEYAIDIFVQASK